MKIEVKESRDERTFILYQELISSNINQLESEMNKYMKENSKDIIIDLINVTKIDSISIATLIRIKNRLTEEGRNLKLRNPNESVMRVLELAGLQEFLLE